MDKSEQIIRVAILSDEFLGWGSGKQYFKAILHNYSWKNNDTSYRFSIQYINDKDIIDGILQGSSFDVLLVPGGGVGDGHAILKGLPGFKVKTWKKNIARFIKDGGGYVGICGGAALMTSLNSEDDGFPRTILERLYDRSAIGVSTVQSYYKHLATPLFYPFQYNHPEKIGATGYVFSFAPGITSEGKSIFSGGIPVHCTLNKDSAVFFDCKRDVQIMRWWGGPALLVPEKTNRQISVLARYPQNDFSQEKHAQIFAWKYIGGIRGLLKGFIKGLFFAKKHKNLRQLFLYAYYFSGDWVKTKRSIDLNFSNKPCMTSEVYPNEQKGRIILCATHPEYIVWNGGHISEMDDEPFNCIATGFHQWKNITLTTPSGEQDLMSAWWIVRRITAWVAKIDDNHLPPRNDTFMNADTKKILSEQIFWDGSIKHQIKKI